MEKPGPGLEMERELACLFFFFFFTSITTMCFKVQDPKLIELNGKCLINLSELQFRLQSAKGRERISLVSRMLRKS